MFKHGEAKREEKAKKFISGAKEEFKKHIPRDTIGDVSVTECVEKDGAFVLGGSVGTTSPTGKLKTFMYSADVNVDADGNCTLEKLTVSDL